MYNTLIDSNLLLEDGWLVKVVGLYQAYAYRVMVGLVICN